MGPHRTRRRLVCSLTAILLALSQGPTEASDAMTDPTLTAMIQTLVDHPELDRYFHADTVVDRTPLVIVIEGRSTADVGPIEKFGAPALVRDVAPADRPALHVSVTPDDGGAAALDFAYPPEGIAGRAAFDPATTPPRLTDMRIVER